MQYQEYLRRGICAIALMATCGCISLKESHHDWALRHQASNCYKEQRAAYGAPEFEHDFAHGWKQGYYNVSIGESVAPPTTPPPRYWKLHYQNPDGKDRIAAWFDGYRRGATYAAHHGRDIYNTVPTQTDVSSLVDEAGETPLKLEAEE